MDISKLKFTEVTPPGRESMGPESEEYHFEEVGQTLIGRLVHIGQVPTPYGKRNKYVFETEEGNKSILGTFKTDELLANVKLRNIVQLTYLGKVPTTGGSMKNYKVKQASDENSETT